MAGLALTAGIFAGPHHAEANPALRSPHDAAARIRSLSVTELRRLLVPNVIYVFCLNVPEVALPLVLVTRLHASPAWAAAVFVTNTVLVVALQVPVTVWMSSFSRRSALAVAGVVLAARGPAALWASLAAATLLSAAAVAR